MTPTELMEEMLTVEIIPEYDWHSQQQVTEHSACSGTSTNANTTTGGNTTSLDNDTTPDWD
jgi:hypothetical protein